MATRTYLKTLAPIVMIVACVAGALSLIQSQADKPVPGAVSTEVGATLPDLVFKQFGGQPIKASELKSKVTLINFWATWCEACVIEMPSIVRLRNSFKDRGFDVVAVSMDDNPEKVLQRSLNKFKIDFPVYIDPESQMADQLSISSIPLTFVIDRNRKILYKESGGRDWNDSEMKKKMARWLSG